LAILPDQIGACSCEDGCGLGANKKKKCDNEEDVEDEDEDKQDDEIESGKIESNSSVNNAFVRKNSNINKLKEDKKMAKNECPKCLEKINAVIANKDSGFVEADREWLEVLSETALDKTITPKVKEVEKIVEKTVEVNALSDDDKAALAFGKKQLKERREGWVKGVQANTDKVWSDEKLNKMDDETLEGIYKSVVKEEQPSGNYSLNVGGVNVNTTGNSTEEILLPSGIEFEVKK
jgi:hypothetical protein